MNLKRKIVVLVSCVFSFLLLEHRLRPPAEELRLSDWFHPGLSTVWGFCNDVSATHVGRRSFQLSRELTCGTDPQDRAMRKRPDVVTITDWLAPVIWEGTFNRQVLGRYYGRQNLTIGLAVLATGRTADQYLELFMRSANKHFMSGYRVVFYIMVDALPRLPDLEPDPLRTFKVLPIKGDRWGDFHLTRMSSLAEHILGHIEDEVDFLFSMTVNRVFQNDFGVETLGASVAQLHAWWYFKNKDIPYERRPKLAACIPFGQGDFYYDGSVIGGRPLEVLTLIEGYLQGVTHDHKNGLNSTYERHLNKYFFTHKPTKLLSPEYSWNAALRPPPQVWSVKATRLSRRYF
ncbi:putative glycosyltransferase 6 domain-containing protein 1 isoform X3 [Felis catus]|uniref:putative glycosyltransferase 6 domain-containing protein 1 isoform X3 n=1 Tax=Felis catus TaxID=9685 RepID=UPI001D1A300B|nr:putative glycosyltransferase 6 domain-containing protein 1 isoform X3 [Felis catus]XP_044899361.1 putative glycosyltransferase 6 domain-containing protein 1 isoform X3 [Felis catus]